MPSMPLARSKKRAAPILAPLEAPSTAMTILPRGSLSTEISKKTLVAPVFSSANAALVLENKGAARRVAAKRARREAAALLAELI